MEAKVVRDGVTRNVVRRVGQLDVAGRTSDDDGDLALVVQVVTVRWSNDGTLVGVQRRDGLLEPGRRRGQLDAELTDARDVIEVTAEDFGGRYGRQMRRARCLDPSPVGCDQCVPIANDVNDVAIKKNASILQGTPKYRL